MTIVQHRGFTTKRRLDKTFTKTVTENEKLEKGTNFARLRLRFQSESDKEHSRRSYDQQSPPHSFLHEAMEKQQKQNWKQNFPIDRLTVS